MPSSEIDIATIATHQRHLQNGFLYVGMGCWLRTSKSLTLGRPGHPNGLLLSSKQNRLRAARAAGHPVVEGPACQSRTLHGLVLEPILPQDNSPAEQVGSFVLSLRSGNCIRYCEVGFSRRAVDGK